MANGVYKITEDFEKALSDYTGIYGGVPCKLIKQI